MGRLPTIQDVARLADVSRQTVSNVINSPAIVKAPTRERVLNAINQLGYRPHASARRLRTQQSSTIGVRLEPERNGISGSVLDAFLHALTDCADRRGMRILLFTAADTDAEIAQYRRLRDGSDIDAFVLTSTSYNDARAAWLIENDMPFVSFGRPWGLDASVDSQHRWVDVDGRLGVREATEHLIAQGAKRVGYIGWPAGSGAGEDRYHGWRDVVGEVDAVDPDLAMAVEDSVSEGSRVAKIMLTHEPPVDAIVCASDTLALGARLAATSLGRETLPVIGFDDTPVARAIGMSSVQQPLAEVAFEVIQLLMGTDGSTVIPNPAHNEEPTNRLLAPRLVDRRYAHLTLDGSTGL